MFIPANEKRRSNSRCTRTPRFVTVVTVGVTAVGILSGLAPSASAEPAAIPLMVDVVGDSSTADGAELDPVLQALSRVAEENRDLALDVSVAAAPGARTADYFGAQPSADGQTTVNSAQHDQIRPDAQVVLVRFGGNDAELAKVLGMVKQANSTEPGDLDVTMRSIEGLLDLSATDGDYLTQALETAPTMVSRMLQVLGGITHRAPDAQLVVANYPLAVDAQDPLSLAQAEPRDLVAAQKVNYDLNESIARAVRICQCADLVDGSDAVAGHEVYTDDPAFSAENPAQPNDKGAALMASPLAADLAGVLGVRAPEATATMIAEPSNVETRAAVSDVDGDTVPDAEDSAPTVPNSDNPAPEPAQEDPGPVEQGLPPNPNPGRDNPEVDADSDDDTGDVSDTTMFASTLSMAAAAAPSSAKASRSPKGRAAQTPPVPTRNPDKGDDLGEVPMPDFSLPTVFGDEESRAIALAQLGFADWTQQQVAPGDSNSVTVDTVAGASRKSKLSGKQFQSTKATRNVLDGTLELEVSTRTGFDQEVVVAKYARGLVDKTAYKLGPESMKQYDQNGKLPDWGTMRPGDIITRTPQNPRAVASEWGLSRTLGKAAKAQAVSYSEGPMGQYTVTALGDGNYSVAFGDTASNTKRNTLSAKGLLGGTYAGANAETTRTEVMYSARTPAKLGEMTQALAGLEKGVTPTLRPGMFYNSITETRSEATTTGYGSKGGKKATTAPKQGVDPTSFITAEAEVGVTAQRDGVTTTKTTLMKSVDGTLQNSEPVGQYTVVTTRLNSGLPGGPYGVLPNSAPLSTQVRSFYDGPLHANTITFSMNGEKHTMSEGDIVQRAREMAVADPETVQSNQVLSDLARGVGIGPALSLVNSNETDMALRALVTPPTPDRNPFAAPPMPEQNMWSVPDQNPFIPPMPEQRPADVPPLPERSPVDTPPLPERRADFLSPEEGLQDLASADMLSADLAGDLSFDSLDVGSTPDSVSDVAADGYSVPGVDVGSSLDGVPGTASDLGGYSVPGTSEGSSLDGVPGTASDLGGYSVPGVDVGSSSDGVPGTASDLGGYSVPGTSEGSSSDGVPGTASDVGVSDSYGGSDGYSVPGTSEGSSPDGVPGTASDVGGSTGYSSDTTSYGGDSTTSYGGDSSASSGDSSTSSYGGDSSASSFGDSSTSSLGGDSSTSSYGGDSSASSFGGDSSGSSFGGGDSSTSSFGGGDSSSSSFGGGSTSSGDSGGGSVGGGDGGGW
jgi:hypothetical protein